jgi:hypothetical protein
MQILTTGLRCKRWYRNWRILELLPQVNRLLVAPSFASLDSHMNLLTKFHECFPKVPHFDSDLSIDFACPYDILSIHIDYFFSFNAIAKQLQFFECRCCLLQ